MINLRDLWDKEWENAYAFFNSKGNTKTKSRIKKKWYKEFKEMLMLVEKEVYRNKNKKFIVELNKRLSSQTMYKAKGNHIHQRMKEE